MGQYIKRNNLVYTIVFLKGIRVVAFIAIEDKKLVDSSAPYTTRLSKCLSHSKVTSFVVYLLGETVIR